MRCSSNVILMNKIIYSLSQAKLLILLNSVHPLKIYLIGLEPRVDLNVSAGLQDSSPSKTHCSRMGKHLQMLRIPAQRLTAQNVPSSH